ncbi:MAG TPA: Clp protease N-terminal domain-containing protein, partial [Acidimicrobiales bacterium]
MALDPNRWTLKTQEAFNAAVDLARTRNNPEVTPDHLLLAMLGQEDTVVLPVLGKVGLAPLTLRNRTEEAIAKL